MTHRICRPFWIPHLSQFCDNYLLKCLLLVEFQVKLAHLGLLPGRNTPCRPDLEPPRPAGGIRPLGLPSLCIIHLRCSAVISCLPTVSPLSRLTSSHCSINGAPLTWSFTRQTVMKGANQPPRTWDACPFQNSARKRGQTGACAPGGASLTLPPGQWMIP